LAAPGSTTTVTLASGEAVLFIAEVIGKTSGGDFYSKVIIGVIDNTGGTTTISQNLLGAAMNTVGAAAWDITLAADDTNDRLAIKVTGAAATNINWAAVVTGVRIKA